MLKKLIIIFILVNPAFSQNVVLNEIMSKNNNSITDIDGENKDWIELYNPNQNVYVLQGYFLSDDISDLTKWPIPNTSIPPMSHKLIFASGKNLNQQELHTNFTISSSGEKVFLVNSNFTIVDSVYVVPLNPDQSYSRQTDGSLLWMVSNISTPGNSNLITPPPNIQNNFYSGVYNDSAVFNVSVHQNYKIHYNNSFINPTYQDSVYTTPITFFPLKTANFFSEIPSSVVFSPPTDTINKINVLKYAAFDSLDMVSSVRNNSFLINANYSLPIVSLTLDPEYLFHSDSGFYIPGSNPGNPPWHTNANFYQKNREVPGYFEYFEDNLIKISHPIGIKLHGGLTRNYSQKSIKLVARSEYGKSEFNYNFFRNESLTEFDRLVLRNGGQDISRAIIRDAFIHRTVKDLNVLTMNVQPTILFLNGEYWGIHNLRDKIDEHYIENKLGINKDSIDLLHGNAEIIEGDNQEYLDLIDYVDNHDLSNSIHYNYVRDKINISNFIDYYLVEIYFNNREWPHNNVKYYKEKGANKKWNWILFDLDITSGAWSACKADKDSYLWLSDTVGYPAWSRTLFVNLSNNNEFKNAFANRFADIKNTLLEPNNQLYQLNNLKNELDPEMDEHLERWNHIPSKSDWVNRVGVVEVFINQRQDYIWSQTRDFFNLGDTVVTVTLNNNILNGGNTLFSTLRHDSLPWSGIYYKDTEIKLEAIPNPGYEFSHWLESNDTSMVKYVTLTSDTTFTAIYNQISYPITDLVINEFLTSNSNDTKDNYNEFEDWLELYNNGSNIIDLNQIYISDDIDLKTKFKVHFTDSTNRFLSPFETCVFYADKDTLQGFNHLNFSLSNSGEELIISQLLGSDTLILDSITYNQRISNVSYGRFPNGNPNYRNLAIPSFNSDNIIKEFNDQLRINEILAKNISDTTDNTGENEDWIEVYNVGNDSVKIGGYFISDDQTDPLKYKISTLNYNSNVVGSENFKIFFADDDIEQGVNHLPFKLSSSGETILISYLDNETIIVIDELTYPLLNSDSSYGCYPDGDMNKVIFERTTPNYSNNLSFQHINESFRQQFMVFPNPTKGIVNIVSNINIYNIEVYNLVGKKIRSINTYNKEMYQINIEETEAGIYFLKINENVFQIIIK